MQMSLNVLEYGIKKIQTRGAPGEICRAESGGLGGAQGRASTERRRQMRGSLLFQMEGAGVGIVTGARIALLQLNVEAVSGDAAGCFCGMVIG